MTGPDLAVSILTAQAAADGCDCEPVLVFVPQPTCCSYGLVHESSCPITRSLIGRLGRN